MSDESERDMAEAQDGQGPDLAGVAGVLGVVPATVMRYLHEISASLFAIRCSSPWLTVTEAERYARVRRGTVRDAVRAGEIRGFRRTSGSVVIVRVADVDRWIESTWPMSTNGFTGAKA